MMGIPLGGNTSVFCDNEGVVKYATAPESPLKKHMAIGYHRCHKALSAGFMQLAKEEMKTNIADAFTKLLPGPRWKELLGWVLYGRSGCGQLEINHGCGRCFCGAIKGSRKAVNKGTIQVSICSFGSRGLIC
jgi:hypothetical protein